MEEPIVIGNFIVDDWVFYKDPIMDNYNNLFIHWIRRISCNQNFIGSIQVGESYSEDYCELRFKSIPGGKYFWEIYKDMYQEPIWIFGSTEQAKTHVDNFLIKFSKMKAFV